MWQSLCGKPAASGLFGPEWNWSLNGENKCVNPTISCQLGTVEKKGPLSGLLTRATDIIAAVTAVHLLLALIYQTNIQQNSGRTLIYRHSFSIWMSDQGKKVLASWLRTSRG